MEQIQKQQQELQNNIQNNIRNAMPAMPKIQNIAIPVPDIHATAASGFGVAQPPPTASALAECISYLGQSGQLTLTSESLLKGTYKIVCSTDKCVECATVLSKNK